MTSTSRDRPTRTARPVPCIGLIARSMCRLKNVSDTGKTRTRTRKRVMLFRSVCTATLRVLLTRPHFRLDFDRGTVFLGGTGQLFGEFSEQPAVVWLGISTDQCVSTMSVKSPTYIASTPSAYSRQVGSLLYRPSRSSDCHRVISRGIVGIIHGLRTAVARRSWWYRRRECALKSTRILRIAPE